eukprot:Nitzschia sp. Nitz4//scaffold347_size17400//9706//11130//NITZ4_008835-RA/size17400-processed-gene-0.18-mRNA-1//-1//CDS//3329548666//3619//frame0
MTSDGQVPVVYVPKHRAKATKKALEDVGFLDKNFRMVPADVQSGYQDAIALPINCTLDKESSEEWTKDVLGTGQQHCPFSTKMGNNRQNNKRWQDPSLSLVQQALLQALFRNPSTKTSCKSWLDKLKVLDTTVCPKKLEVFGDDRTLVLPPGAFEGPTFLSLVEEAGVEMDTIWPVMLVVHGSSRIVRRGAIDPESGTRQSGHRMVYPLSGVSEATGPGSPGWICVTEQGIRQSFDLTRVMFSRGNISEKIRFGKICQEGEVLLDMYTGIGYYTLPALIHGKVEKVVSLEWNEDAIQALQFNVADNKVADRVQIYQGDCRKTAKQHQLEGMFDRVSLGLLPSSEGGWETAVRALHKERGGWLHVHGNVPNSERDTWALWMCRSLQDLCKLADRPSDWIVLCTHLERVKSFAPTVSHFVADIFVGPPHNHPNVSTMGDATAGVLRDSVFVPSTEHPTVPSCALSPTGVLKQTWMR